MLGQHRAQWRRHQKNGILDPTGRREDAPSNSGLVSAWTM
jgi:hypothetical protein